MGVLLPQCACVGQKTNCDSWFSPLWCSWVLNSDCRPLPMSCPAILIYLIHVCSCAQLHVVLWAASRTSCMHPANSELHVSCSVFKVMSETLEHFVLMGCPHQIIPLRTQGVGRGDKVLQSLWAGGNHGNKAFRQNRNAEHMMS